MNFYKGILGILLAVTIIFIGSVYAQDTKIQPILRVDANRDGKLSAEDDKDKNKWTTQRGAIFLPNLDDDQSRCPQKGADGKTLPDDELPKCNDATDGVVNGLNDLADLAPLSIEPVKNISNQAKATLIIDKASQPYVQIFVNRGGKMVPLGKNGSLNNIEIRRGVKLAIEGSDIVRNPKIWSGFVNLTLRVSDGEKVGVDQTQIRVSPLVLQNSLMKVQQVIVSKNTDSNENTYDLGEKEFRHDLRAGLDKAGIHSPFFEVPMGDKDIWAQDVFQPAYVSMPSVGGKEHHININIRSSSVNLNGWNKKYPLREGGQSVFTTLRGPNVGGIQQYDPKRVKDPNQFVNGTFDSGGNIDVIPPYKWAGRNYSIGRMLYGAHGEFAPDKSFTQMLEAQGYQRPIQIDTSWLAVGHVDEFMTFLPAKNTRGWVVVVADPLLGQSLLQKMVKEGKGNLPLIQGVKPEQTEDPNVTVAQALQKKSLLRGTQIAASGIDKALQVLRKETGITEKEIIRLPALFNEIQAPKDYPRKNLTYNYLPGISNGFSTGNGFYLAPQQHGPQDQGKDVFEKFVEKELEKIGNRVIWIEDWNYGTVGGDVHCLTNPKYDLSGTKPWWNEHH
jgi:protein-arginine deiminase